MNAAETGRPPYLAAIGVTAAVLLGYLLTLAPTVTFWDAGEFIAAAYTLGIPHPPGTPLFVLIAHVWGTLLPIGEFAFRTNLLSAMLSAGAAGFFFLVVHETLAGLTDGLERQSARALRLAGAGCAAVLGAFTFTNWQNSNETEVYGVATFTIAAMAWLVHVWRRRRGEERAPRLLLLVVFLAGISIGNHLLALLAGPAVVAFLVATLWRSPAADSRIRREEWGQVAVVVGVWALLIGTGLGSITLTVVGAVCFLGAAAYAATGGAGAFALASLAIAAVGITPYLYLYIRSGQHPMVNEAAPATFDALLAVIRRAQYPPRTPFDDPTVPHGSDNPGRTLGIFWLQLVNYFQYFDWQWARSLGAARAVLTVLFLSLGVRGALAQRRSDRAGWWLLLVLFLTTGLGLVVYMNFKPGFSIGYDRYPESQDHEVRERDYFFVVSFVVWGLWAGIGAAALVRALLAKAAGPRRLAPLLLGVLAAVPVALNWSAASRRHGPDARLAADFAYDLLNSAPPYGVLFTYGDNDTFPLWWAQEVAGVRQDVTVVCLALANTDWYMRQLRDNPTRPVDVEALPAFWRDSIPPRPDWPLHGMTDSMIARAMEGYYVPERQTVKLGPVTRELKAGTVLYPNDIVSLSLVQQNIGRRPIVWAVTAGRGYAGLGDHVVQRGLGFHLEPSGIDTTGARYDLRRLAGAPLDLPATETLVYDVYRYAGLLEQGAAALEATSASAASSLSLPFVQLVYAYQARGDTARVRRAIDRAVRLSPNPEMRDALLELSEQPADRPTLGE